MRFRPKKCGHIEAISEIRNAKFKECECEACVENEDSWVHLRTCQTCGITLCCDSSLNKHASKHAHEYGYPVIISTESNKKWMWAMNIN